MVVCIKLLRQFHIQSSMVIQVLIQQYAFSAKIKVLKTLVKIITMIQMGQKPSQTTDKSHRKNMIYQKDKRFKLLVTLERNKDICIHKVANLLHSGKHQMEALQFITMQMQHQVIMVVQYIQKTLKLWILDLLLPILVVEAI